MRIVLLAIATACVFANGPALAATPLRLTAEECRVWQREQGFARSVAEHDAAAFAEHLSEQAAFGASQPEPTRGRAEIVRRWAGIIEGKRVRLRWYPTRVTIAGVEDIAWSSGPSLSEALDPKASHRYMIGAFHSVWHKGSDGVWRVLFDDGVDPRPATEAEVRAFEAGRADCTAAGA